MYCSFASDNTVIFLPDYSYQTFWFEFFCRGIKSIRQEMIQLLDHLESFELSVWDHPITEILFYQGLCGRRNGHREDASHFINSDTYNKYIFKSSLNHLMGAISGKKFVNIIYNNNFSFNILILVHFRAKRVHCPTKVCCRIGMCCYNMALVIVIGISDIYQ